MKRQAEAALAEVKRDTAKNFYAFGDAARAKSEDEATRTVGGELPFSRRDDLQQRLGPEVAAAAFEMRGNGTIRDALVETPKGFYILRLLAREEASSATFEDVRESIRHRLDDERRQQRYRKLVS